MSRRCFSYGFYVARERAILGDMWYAIGRRGTRFRLVLVAHDRARMFGGSFTSYESVLQALGKELARAPHGLVEIWNRTVQGAYDAAAEDAR